MDPVFEKFDDLVEKVTAVVDSLKVLNQELKTRHDIYGNFDLMNEVLKKMDVVADQMSEQGYETTRLKDHAMRYVVVCCCKEKSDERISRRQNNKRTPR